MAVRVDGAARVLLITQQQRTRFTWERNSRRRGRERYFVHEIWSFDAATAQPLWTPTATYVFQKAGLVHGEQWFGLLAPDEAAVYRRRESLPSDRASSDRRVRLYRAQTRAVSNETANWPRELGGDWGKRKVMSGPTPLPVKTDDLDGGLFSGGSSNSPPLRASDPDSLLILHRDRLGEAGKLQITRVDLAGNPIWNGPRQPTAAHDPGLRLGRPAVDRR